MKELVTDIVFPEKIESQLSFSTQGGEFSFEKNSDGEIMEANVSIKLITELSVNGVAINFESRISHTLTSEELKSIIEKS